MKQKGKIKKATGAGIFVIGACMLLYVLSQILMDKSTYGVYKNFLKQEDVDVLILGSSHSMSAFGAADIEEQLRQQTSRDINVFNYSVYGMRMEQLYYVCRELLKEQTPELIVVESFSFLETEEDDREVLARKAFDYLPYSADKMEAVKDCVNPAEEDLLSYKIPLLKYHSRWKELSQQDFEEVLLPNSCNKYGRDYLAAEDALPETDDYFSRDMNAITGEREIGERSEDKLRKLLALAEERGIKVLFVAAPYKMQMGLPAENLVQMNYYVQNRYVDGEKVQLFDMNLHWKELQFGYSDLSDEGHCNRQGAKKVSKYLAEYLMEQYPNLAEQEGEESL